MSRWLLVWLAVVGGPSLALAQDDKLKIAGEARDILKAACGRCHNGEGSSTKYKFDVTALETLTKPVGDRKKAVIVPGKPDDSPIWKAIDDERMPDAGSIESETFKRPQFDVVKKWIELGAPAFPRAGEHRKFLTLETTLMAMKNHLAKLKLKDRPNARFFSIATVHNNKDVSDAELRYHRAALAKAVNSVSWANAIEPIVEVPETQATLFAVDILALQWNEEHRWEKIAKAHPYSLGFGDIAALKDVEQEIQILSRDALPLIRGDWFVATATRPPLYHDLLNIPTNAMELEHRLKVDIAKNFEQGKLARAAFTKSGVSAQNRMVERHAATGGGAYWKSYDFLPGAVRGRLAKFPLGPRSLFAPGKHPFDAAAFEHDGGEIIFNLPNGLQAYMLVNKKDERIDEGPISVVFDNNKTGGTPAIVNGVSCMACHSQGIIPFKDTVRNNPAVFDTFAEKVRDIYPEASEMEKLVEDDRSRFTMALTRAVKPWLLTGENTDKPIESFREPIQLVATDHRNRQLTLEAVARELDLDSGDALQKRVGEKAMKKLGLQALIEASTIPRLEWESGLGRSLMQQFAAELGYSAR